MSEEAFGAAVGIHRASDLEVQNPHLEYKDVRFSRI
jgi:hypothetical protein